MEVGDKGSFIVERSVVVAEVGAVVFKGRWGGTVPSRGSRAFEGGGRSALGFQGSEGCLDAGLSSGGGLGSSRSGRLQGGFPSAVAVSSVRWRAAASSARWRAVACSCSACAARVVASEGSGSSGAMEIGREGAEGD